jgi:nucleotide-binding universal stress UspA family protein
VRALFGSGDIETDLVDEKKLGLDAIAAPIRDLGLEATTKVLLDRGGIELIREVIRDKHDLLIKASADTAARTRRLRSTVDMRLLRKCPCPVWLFSSATPSRFERLLAAIDPTPGDPDHAALNRKILELAASLCVSEGAALHVVHAWSVPFERRLLAKIGEIKFQSVKDSARAIQEEAIDQLLNQHVPDIVARTVHLLKGDPSSVIPQLADGQQIDLLVMGTVARTDVEGMFMGNTAESILAQGCGSVLAVKPDEFVSPVTIGTNGSVIA